MRVVRDGAKRLYQQIYAQLRAQIFSGEITDNEGNVVVAEGQTLTDAEILAITWFCEGITVN